MKNRTMLFVSLGLVLLSFALSLVLMGFLPERLASHWNMYGQADGYSGRLSGQYLMPTIQLAVLLLMIAIPSLDPLKKNIAQFRGTYNGLVVVMAGFLTYLHILTLLWNLGMSMNMNALMAPAFALMLYAAGVLLGKAQQNYMIGIRTPWTLANRQVWDDTHRVGGLVFKVCAGVCLLGVLFPGAVVYLMVGPILLSTLGLMVYSYIRFVQLSRD